jgi:hypothetical protein
MQFFTLAQRHNRFQMHTQGLSSLPLTSPLIHAINHVYFLFASVRIASYTSLHLYSVTAAHLGKPIANWDTLQSCPGSTITTADYHKAAALQREPATLPGNMSFLKCACSQSARAITLDNMYVHVYTNQKSSIIYIAIS